MAYGRYNHTSQNPLALQVGYPLISRAPRSPAAALQQMPEPVDRSSPAGPVSAVCGRELGSC